MSPLLWALACADTPVFTDEQLIEIQNEYVTAMTTGENEYDLYPKATAFKNLEEAQARRLSHILDDGNVNARDIFTESAKPNWVGFCTTGVKSSNNRCQVSVFSDAQIESLETLGNKPALALIDKILDSTTGDLPEQFPVSDLLTENLSSEKMAELSPLQIQNALIWLLANTAGNSQEQFITDLIAKNSITKTVLAEMDTKLTQDPNSFGHQLSVWNNSNLKDILAQNGLSHVGEIVTMSSISKTIQW